MLLRASLYHIHNIHTLKYWSGYWLGTFMIGIQVRRRHGTSLSGRERRRVWREPVTRSIHVQGCRRMSQFGKDRKFITWALCWETILYISTKKQWDQWSKNSKDKRTHDHPLTMYSDNTNITHTPNYNHVNSPHKHHHHHQINTHINK